MHFHKTTLIFLFISIVSSMLVSCNFIESDPIAQTSSGMIVGQKINLETGSPVYRFLGVPYAQPPVGKNRFERPEAIVNQTDKVIMAKQMKPTCIQMKHFGKAISPLLEIDEIHNISEDCLYLNIYVPVNSDGASLPIMVWLPGEGFDFADARQFNGAYLASIGNVIVITVQYRVGAFGFLNGNAGIWDQIMALKWIQQNALNFGGNNEAVTVFGRFTGSMSISILLTSPEIIKSEAPLFNKAILMSGIAVGNWVFDNKHDTRLSELFENTDCANMDCLKSLSTEQILSKSGFGWKPVIDSTLIDDEPLNVLRKQKFPKYVDSVMLGTNQYEGSLCLLKHLVVDEKFYQNLIKNNVTLAEYEQAIREDLQMFYENDSHSNDRIKSLTHDPSSYVQFCSELLIDSHMKNFETLLHRISENNNRLSTVFKYKLNYKPSFSIAPEFLNSSIHGDDVILAFGLAFKNHLNITDNDRKISKIMVTLFSNFAQSGNPLQSLNEKYIEIKNIPDNQSWKINKSQLVIFCLSVLLLSLATILITLIRYCVKRQTTSSQIKQLIQTYNQFH